MVAWKGCQLNYLWVVFALFITFLAVLWVIHRSKLLLIIVKLNNDCSCLIGTTELRIVFSTLSLKIVFVKVSLDFVVFVGFARSIEEIILQQDFESHWLMKARTYKCLLTEAPPSFDTCSTMKSTLLRKIIFYKVLKSILTVRPNKWIKN